MVPSPEGRTTPLHFLDDSTLGNRRNSGKCFLSDVIQAHFCRFSPTASSKGMYRSPMISPPSLSARRWREKTGETCAACGCGNGGGWRNRKSAVVSPGKAGEGPRRKDAQGGAVLAPQHVRRRSRNLAPQSLGGGRCKPSGTIALFCCVVFGGTVGPIFSSFAAQFPFFLFI